MYRLATQPVAAEHAIVHRHADRFAAWPFNGGLWKYAGDEVVVSFNSRTCHYREKYEVDHGYSPRGVNGPLLVRSRDGGATWTEQEFTAALDLDARLRSGGIPLSYDTALDLRHPDLLLGHYGFCVILSLDRGRTFTRTCRLPSARFLQVMGRPDYVIRPDGACVLFSTVSTTSGVEGRPVVYITRNGARTWEFLNFMTEEPRFHMKIMPSGVWLPGGTLLAAVRVQMEGAAYSLWSEVYASEDGGATWQFRGRVSDLGAPCHLLLLDDGRVLATYGYRTAPFGIRARLSADEGRNWGPELILRDDGGSWDLGYAKTVQLDGGDLLSLYYFNDQNDPVQLSGGVRYIAASRWQAPD